MSNVKTNHPCRRINRQCKRTSRCRGNEELAGETDEKRNGVQNGYGQFMWIRGVLHQGYPKCCQRDEVSGVGEAGVGKYRK